MIYIVNGPNLNLLGKREPSIYGKTTLEEINKKLHKIAEETKEELVFFQNNSEGSIIDYLQSLSPHSKVIFNPGALAHTSIALRDCISGCELDVIEVHISNIYNREEFRHHSFISPVCLGTITGLGINSYILALNYFLNKDE